MTQGDCVDVHLAPAYMLSGISLSILYVELLLVIILFWPPSWSLSLVLSCFCALGYMTVSVLY